MRRRLLDAILLFVLFGCNPNNTTSGWGSCDDAEPTPDARTVDAAASLAAE